MQAIIVRAEWDEEAGVWVAEAENLPDGFALATGATTLEELEAKLPGIVQDLLDRDIIPPIEIVAKVRDPEDLSEMASFGSEVTGVSNTIFISSKAGVRHGPHVRVAINPPTHLNPGGDTASITFDGMVAMGDIPALLLKQVQEFIELNRPVLIDYWEFRIDTEELQQRLRPIDLWWLQFPI